MVSANENLRHVRTMLHSVFSSNRIRVRRNIAFGTVLFRHSLVKGSAGDEFLVRLTHAEPRVIAASDFD